MKTSNDENTLSYQIEKVNHAFSQLGRAIYQGLRKDFFRIKNKLKLYRMFTITQSLIEIEMAQEMAEFIQLRRSKEEYEREIDYGIMQSDLNGWDLFYSLVSSGNSIEDSRSLCEDFFSAGVVMSERTVKTAVAVHCQERLE